MVTVWWPAANRIHYSFLNLSETITSETYVHQTDEMHKNCDTYSWYWSAEWAWLFSMAMPDCTTNVSKVEQIGQWSFAPPTILIWPLANQLLQVSWQIFAGKMLLQPAGGRKCFLRVHWIPKMDFFFICGGFCHTLKRNSHRFTCVPHPDSPSHLPLHPLPLGFPSAPGPSACLMHPTWAGDLFHPREYTCFDAVLLKHPTLAFSHRV